MNEEEEEISEQKNERNNKIDLYKLVWDLQNQESNRFWQRNTVFLLLHGGLLAILSTTNLQFMQMIISLEGFFLAIFWLGVLKRGKDYVYRWNRVLTRIENENKNIIQIPVKHFEENAKENDPPDFFPFSCFKGETTDIIRWVIYSLILAWSFLLITSWWETLRHFLVY